MTHVLQLVAGDRMTRCEFHRRYEAMPHCKKAELVEGVVHMPSPVSHTRHARPHFHLLSVLGNYCAATPGLDAGDNATVLLDLANELQPDVHLRIAHGGSSRVRADGYLEGPPELVAEVSASSASYDLHDKLRAYERNGANEYLVWRVDDAAIDWFSLRDDRFERIAVDADGLLRSRAFPGLWLDAGALLALDLPRALAAVARGTATREHAEFVARLSARAR